MIPAMRVFKPVTQITGYKFCVFVLIQILPSHLTQNDILKHSMNSLNQCEIEEAAVFENSLLTSHSSAASAPSAP